MSRVNLEVGKAYEVRDSHLVASCGLSTIQIIQKVLPDNRNSTLSFISDTGRVYMSNGRFLSDESPLDLVREISYLPENP